MGFVFCVVEWAIASSIGCRRDSGQPALAAATSLAALPVFVGNLGFQSLGGREPRFVASHEDRH